MLLQLKNIGFGQMDYLQYPTIPSKHQFRKAKNSMVILMHKAMSEFYLCEITSVTSGKSLFAVCNKLLGLEKLAPFPNIYLIDQLPAILRDFLLIKLN